MKRDDCIRSCDLYDLGHKHVASKAKKEFSVTVQPRPQLPCLCFFLAISWHRSH
jgi:hypothetical protein